MIVPVVATATKLGVWVAALVASSVAILSTLVDPTVEAAVISAVGTIIAAGLSCVNLWLNAKILRKANENQVAVNAAKNTARASMDELRSIATDATDAPDHGKGG